MKRILLFAAIFWNSVSAFAQVYCTPSYTGYGIDINSTHFAYATSFTHIAKVQFGDINFTNLQPSWYTTIPPYINQTGTPTTPTSCVRGLSYPISIQMGNGANVQTLSVWVDFNGNKNFESSERIIFTTDPANVGTHIITSTVAVPANAALGVIRMRMGTKFGSNASLDPCVNNDPATPGGGNNWSQQFVDFAINIVAGQPQIFQSSTTTQTLFDDVTKGSTNNQIIGIEINTNSNGSLNPLTTGAFDFSSIGTTNPNEITKARLFYTGLKSTFDTTTAVGSAITNPGNSFSINPGQTLLPGKNYFWLTYDISPTAILDNKIDARCNYITVGGIQRVPTVVSPAGNRQVGYCISKGTQSFYVYINQVRLNKLTNFTYYNFNTGYDNYTYLSDTIVKSSSTVLKDTLFITLGNGVNSSYYAAWIDFNRDGFFDDVTELVAKDSISRNGSSALLIEKASIFNIPTTAVCGKTRMRISCQSATAPSACTNPTLIGEVEDYTVVIKEDGQPVADFKAGTVCFGDSTFFTDQSIAFGGASVNSWSWDFGNPASGAANTSTAQFPKHKFTAPGVYNVKLTVTSSASGSTSSTITKAVSVEKPVAQFTMSSTSVNTPIVFSDASTGGAMILWNWNFGDPSSGVNNTSNAQNPTHTFATGGVYNVRLIVTSSAGCVDTIIKTISIQLAAPIAAFTSNTFTPYVGANTNLIDISVNNPTSWNWVITPNTFTFQNSTTSSSQNPVVAFNALTTYTVKLIVCNVSGCDSTTKTFTTKAYTKPVAAFSASPLNVRVGQIVSFLDQSTNDPTTWLWNFGDNSTSTQQYPQHFYNTADTFTVSLQASNPAGTDSTRKVKYIIVTDGYTMCDNTATQTTNKSGVIMDSGGNDGNYGDNETCGFLIQPNCAGVIKFKFKKFRLAVNDFVRVYDGTNDTTGIPLHTGNGFTGNTIPDTLYANSGAIFVRIQTNIAGNDSGFVAQWFADDNVKPKVTIIADTVGYINSLVRFTNGTTGAGNTYVWDVNGDGVNDSTTTDAAYRFTTTGTFKIRLIARNCKGQDTGFFTIKILNPTRVPQADFMANKTVIDLNDEIRLIDLSLYGTSGWKWEITQDATGTPSGYVYTNGTNDTMSSPTVLFYEAGYYTVCLTSKNIIGSSTKYCKTGYIFVKDRGIMCFSTNFSNTKQGKMFDSGDKSSNYSNGELCDFTINVNCASRIVMTFKSFNFLAGDELRIYDGQDSITGIPLFLGTGFTGANSPGTLTAYSGSFYLVEKTNATGTAAGFEADWIAYDKDTSNTKPDLSASDTGYVNAMHIFKSYSQPNAIYSYDFDGNASMDTISNKSVFPFKYTSAGTFTASMYDSGCNNISASKNVVILNPTKKPTADFDADQRNPSVRDTVVLYDASKFGATAWKWTITPASYTLVKSSLTNGIVRVVFNTPGTYDICFRATNSFGADSLCKTAFINVHPVCIPTFSGGQIGIGISHVKIGLMNNVTTMVYGYHDYTETHIVQLEKGSTGNPVIFERLQSATPQTWSIWLDANQDGQFTLNEMVAQLQNATATTITGNITIPNTALAGRTRMRVAAYFGSAVIDGCSPMTNGEVEDYGVLIIGDRTKPVITLLGNNPDSVEVAKPYTDPGATALDNVNGNITANIVVTGTVNTAIEGVYYLKYNVKDSSGNAADEKVRTVKVTKDVTKPVITLTGGDTVYVEVHTAYNEPGATATDLKDGNITSKIVIVGTVDTSTLGSYTITYQVTDNAGNVSVKYRKVIVRDTTKPVITLLGSAIINIERSTTPWVDPGTTVTDNYDKGLSATRTGTVLNNVIGQYVLLYDVTDNSGNKAVTVQRTVNVTPPAMIQQVLHLQHFDITPNPGNGVYKVQVEFEKAVQAEVKITDINGKVLQVYTREMLSDKFTLDLTNYANGVYLFSISTSEGVMTRKLVKE